MTTTSDPELQPPTESSSTDDTTHCTIIVRHLRPSTTDAAVRQHLERIADVLSISRSAARDEAVVVADSRVSALQMVRLLNGSLINGQPIDLTLNVPEPQAPPSDKSSMSTTSSNAPSVPLLETKQSASVTYTQTRPSSVSTKHSPNKRQAVKDSQSLSPKQLAQGNALLRGLVPTASVFDEEDDLGNPLAHVSHSGNLRNENPPRHHDYIPPGCDLVQDEQHVRHVWATMLRCCTAWQTAKLERQASKTDESVQSLAKRALSAVFMKGQRAFRQALNTKEQLLLLQRHRMHYSVSTVPAGRSYILVACSNVEEKDSEIQPCYLMHLPRFPISTELFSAEHEQHVDISVFKIPHAWFVSSTMGDCVLLGDLAAETGITQFSMPVYRLWCHDCLAVRGKPLHSAPLAARLQIAYEEIFWPQAMSVMVTAHRMQPETATGTSQLRPPLQATMPIQQAKFVHFLPDRSEVAMFGRAPIFPCLRRWPEHFGKPASTDSTRKQLKWLSRMPYEANHLQFTFMPAWRPRKRGDSVKTEVKSEVVDPSVKQESGQPDMSYDIFDSDATLPVAWLYDPHETTVATSDLLESLKPIRAYVKLAPPSP